MLPLLLAARVITRLAVGGRDDAAIADAHEEALRRKLEAAVADAIACVGAHRASGDVVGSTGSLPLLAGTPRPVLVNACGDDARKVERVLGRRPELVTWR